MDLARIRGGRRLAHHYGSSKMSSSFDDSLDHHIALRVVEATKALGISERKLRHVLPLDLAAIVLAKEDRATYVATQFLWRSDDKLGLREMAEGLYRGMLSDARQKRDHTEDDARFFGSFRREQTSPTKRRSSKNPFVSSIPKGKDSMRDAIFAAICPWCPGEEPEARLVDTEPVSWAVCPEHRVRWAAICIARVPGAACSDMRHEWERNWTEIKDLTEICGLCTEVGTPPPRGPRQCPGCGLPVCPACGKPFEPRSVLPQF